MADDLAAQRAESHRGHRYIQLVLRGGLAIATLLMLAGTVLALASGQHEAGAVRLDAVLSDGTLGERLIASGLLFLALTPVVRVLALVLVWLRERDRRFALIGFIVLSVLVTSMITGRG